MLLRLERADGTSTAVEAAWVIGAGGAHSVMRASMAESLEGFTYPGTVLAADVRVRCDLARDASNLVATPDGFVLLAPLPDERWLTFVGDPRRGRVGPSGARERRPRSSRPGSVGASPPTSRWRTSDGRRRSACTSAWFRVWPQGRRFLLGDAGHLSSPFGGEGLNAGLHDAQDIAWKLALTVHGRARPALLESFEIERLAADHHVLEVSGRIDGMVRAAVEAARTGVGASPATPAQRLRWHGRDACSTSPTQAARSSENTSARVCSRPLRRVRATASPVVRC